MDGGLRGVRGFVMWLCCVYHISPPHPPPIFPPHPFIHPPSSIPPHPPTLTLTLSPSLTPSLPIPNPSRTLLSFARFSASSSGMLRACSVAPWGTRTASASAIAIGAAMARGRRRRMRVVRVVGSMVLDLVWIFGGGLGSFGPI